MSTTRVAGFAALCAIAWLAACTPETRNPPVVTAAAPAEVLPTWLPADGKPIRWKALLVGGDSKEAAFDNAARAFAAMLKRAGIPPSDIVVLSAYEKERSRSADFASIRTNAEGLAVAPGDGCLVFVTAHGLPAGLHLRGTNSYYYLSPGALDGVLTQGCKQAPTIVVASGCYSGVFAAAPMLAPNRVIYTAARRDRTSFGCNAQLEFTYFDHCLLSSLPELSDWAQLARRAAQCVRQREQKQKVSPPSEPQFAAGADMVNVAPIEMPRDAIRDLWQVVPAQLKDANALPFGGAAGRKVLSDYKSAQGGKALAVGAAGGWSSQWKAKSDEEAADAALAACRKAVGEECLLYAMGDRLIWHDSLRQALESGSPSGRRLVQVE